MTEMFGEAWPPMSVPDLAPDDDDDDVNKFVLFYIIKGCQAEALRSSFMVEWACKNNL